MAAIVSSLDASQLAEEGKQLTAFRLFLLTRRRGQQQQTEAGFPLFILIGAGFPRRFFLQFKNFQSFALEKRGFQIFFIYVSFPFQRSLSVFLLVTERSRISVVSFAFQRDRVLHASLVLSMERVFSFFFKAKATTCKFGNSTGFSNSFTFSLIPVSFSIFLLQVL